MCRNAIGCIQTACGWHWGYMRKELQKTACCVFLFQPEALVLIVQSEPVENDLIQCKVPRIRLKKKKKKHLE